MHLLKAIDAAPFVGAWIEIRQEFYLPTTQKPHPSWVRGLKSSEELAQDLETKAAPFVGAWIEIPTGKTRNTGNHSRTLRGCVD